MNQHDPQNELSELIIRKLDGALTDDEFVRLEQILAENPVQVQYYVNAMITHAILADKSSLPVKETGADPQIERANKAQGMDQDATASDQWQVNARLHEIERYAEEHLERFREQERQRQQELAYRQYRALRRQYMVATGSLVALIAILLFAWLTPGPQSDVPEPFAQPAPTEPAPVATLVKTRNALWEQETLSTEAGTRLTAVPRYLKQGLVQLALDDGAEVILQAPCRFALQTAGRLFITSGKVSAQVPPEAVGFTIETPIGTVVDYGTEFGLMVQPEGAMETQVYNGKVQVCSENTRAIPTQLEQGQACSMDSTGSINNIRFRTKTFMRELPDTDVFAVPGKRLDLSDILVGGNGFGTGDPNQMVNIRSGRVEDLRYNSANIGAADQGGYVSRSLTGVDYLFTADGGSGPVQVSSEGHRFAACPDTNGRFYPYVSNRGMLRHIPGVIASLVLNGRQYGTRANPVIAIHASAGITFDLHAIRGMLPRTRIKCFTAVCGMSETAGIAVLRESGQAALHRADFWVLVDGIARFRAQGLQAQSGGTRININLQDSDRFLTLIVTDGGDSNGYDWGAFAEPALELQ
jgi:ferric-dicitrate binding protein FerR (iron transport regulator)